MDLAAKVSLLIVNSLIHQMKKKVLQILVLKSGPARQVNPGSRTRTGPG